ncbi:proteasome subunit beta [Candidatus Woesearchaeota archaeon]|nr:proteasome subunit beta [Candidatus Woesearchaeota archaeon]MCF7900876.1 proteasome subunit beta [Candidatus Woesearchaeota archaeon]MCF8013891.1 proteasome subunit beta [Candidatus Woesearchaeota archaeon]
MDKENEVLKTGTTTVGVLGKDCVVLAADKRATAGHLIVDKNIEKVLPINNNIALTMAGSVSDVQLLVKYLRAEVNLKEIRTGRAPLVKEAANLLATFNYSGLRSRGSIAHFLLGGYDVNGPHLFDLFPDGSLTEIHEKTGFVTSGSGMVFALGVLEDSWKKDLSENEAVELAVRAISSSLKRDSASGEGIDLWVMDKDGARKVGQRLLNNTLE